jgi:hypothetical protein
MSNIRIQSLAAAILSCAWRMTLESMLRATTPQKPISQPVSEGLYIALHLVDKPRSSIGSPSTAGRSGGGR